MSFIFLLIAVSVLLCTIEFSFGRNDSFHARCGNWQSDYLNRVTHMSNSLIPPKYVMVVPTDGGLADNVLGYLSVLFISILSNRTFLLLNVGGMDDNCMHRDITFGYSQRYYNWSLSNVNRLLYGCFLPPYSMHHLYPCNISKARLFPNIGREFNIRHTRGLSVGLGSWFREFPNFVEDIIVSISNVGWTYRAFDDPNIAILANKIGLTRKTVFPCLFHFLFKMREEACNGPCLNAKQALLAAGGKDSRTIRIGIQVRRDSMIEATEHFFCADSLLNYYRNQGMKVIILFVSASRTLQQFSLDKYGKDVLLLPTGVPESPHGVSDSGIPRPPGLNCADEVNRSRMATLNTARDWSLLSLTDIKILSKDSGFGVVGAMNRLRSKHILYRMPVTTPPTLRDCALNITGDPLSLFATTWSGL